MSDNDNPFVGSAMHNTGKQRDLTGRAARRAEERGYGEPKPERPRKRKNRKGKRK
jgi:hypothetical protein